MSSCATEKRHRQTEFLPRNSLGRNEPAEWVPQPPPPAFLCLGKTSRAAHGPVPGELSRNSYHIDLVRGDKLISKKPATGNLPYCGGTFSGAARSVGVAACTQSRLFRRGAPALRGPNSRGRPPLGRPFPQIPPPPPRVCAAPPFLVR